MLQNRYDVSHDSNVRQWRTRMELSSIPIPIHFLLWKKIPQKSRELAILIKVL